MKNSIIRDAAVAAVALISVAASAQAQTYRVTVENLAPANGTFLTPVWFGFNNGTFDIYNMGEAASEALERIAEDGTVGPIGTAFQNSGAGTVGGAIPGPMGAFAGPIDPGEIASVIVNLDPMAMSSRFFSYASMIIPSNDAFIANGNPMAHQVFDDLGNFLGADFIILGSEVLDAGTEVNDESTTNTAFFGQAAPNTGTPENGTVQIHPGFIPGGPILSDPNFANANFTQPGYQIARITITAAAPEPGTLGLALIGFAGLAGAGFRRIRR
ncbi:MAG: spondin domain-containing protein [Armatimonadaceae bacterium]